MGFLNWLVAPGYHWLILAILIIVAAYALTMIIHGTPAMYDDGKNDDDDDE